MQKILRIDPKDNLIVALRDLAQGDIIENDGQRIQLVTDVACCGVACFLL